MGYDDDPREIPDIPEVVNWIEQSLEAGIPWLYFMRITQDSFGLIAFMLCCGSEHDPKHPGRYNYEKERILSFIKKNPDNLEDFAEKYEIPDDVSCAAKDEIMGKVQSVLQGYMDQENLSETMDRNKQMKEAMERLTTLENIYEINPNIKNTPVKENGTTPISLEDFWAVLITLIMISAMWKQLSLSKSNPLIWFIM